MVQNLSTGIVIGTCAFSLSVLAFMLYASFGLGALKAVAPFAGTLSLTFLAAHCLDARDSAEDVKAAAANGQGPGGTSSTKSGESRNLPGTTGAASSSTKLPRRRRVAD
ncbi:unnamed protein product [Sphacelaria rigidula]